MLAFAQLFAIMPVVGVKSDSASKLKFKWISIRTIYGLVMFALMIGYAGLGLHYMYWRKMEFDAISELLEISPVVITIGLISYLFAVPAVFYMLVVYGMYRFLQIAQKWPSLMQQWELVENGLPKWRSQHEKRQLAFKIKIVAIVVLLSTLGEYSYNNLNE